MTYCKIKITIRIAFVALFFGSCTNQGQPDIDAPSFLTTLDIHLKSIKERNIEELEPTVAENVTMIGPNGKKFDSKKVFMDFHKNWFAQSDWEWDGNILKTETSDSMGYALIQYQFIKKDTLGSTLFQDHEYLILIFKNSVHGWQLMHDQNTGIQELNKN